MYEIIFSNKASKFLNKLPKKDRKHVVEVLKRARIRPEAHFERLVGKRLYKLRAGDYRIIAEINKGILCILVIKIGHRRNIYK